LLASTVHIPLQYETNDQYQMLRIKSQHKAQYSVRFRISPSSYILIKKQHLAKHQKQYRSLHHIYVTIVDI
jgi:hypothetical protein